MTQPLGDSDELVMILEVETPSGVAWRTIRPASILPPEVERGGAAEEATRSVAASWGMPDFVFRAGYRRRGLASRELGDALIIVGDQAASIQVKARAAPSTDPDRERKWLDKKIKEASDQAAGTVRALKVTDAVTVRNERGRSIVISPRALSWLLVVVIDHPGLDGYTPTAPSVVLLRRDWEFLFEQLKSTHAVIEYLRRVSRADPVALGDEPVRYYELAAADAAAPPGPADPRLVALGLDKTRSFPLLPRAPAGHGDDVDHRIMRIILEDIALTHGAVETSRLEAMAAIDAIPVGYRAELSRDVLQWLGEVALVQAPALTWRFRNIPWEGRPYLLFGATSRYTDEIGGFFGGYVSLRHQQMMELMPERAEILSVGVLLTPRGDGVRPWDTTLVAMRGDQGFEPEHRAFLERLWGPMGAVGHDADAALEQWLASQPAGRTAGGEDPFDELPEPENRE